MGVVQLLYNPFVDMDDFSLIDMVLQKLILIYRNNYFKGTPYATSVDECIEILSDINNVSEKVYSYAVDGIKMLHQAHPADYLDVYMDYTAQICIASGLSNMETRAVILIKHMMAKCFLRMDTDFFLTICQEEPPRKTEDGIKSLVAIRKLVTPIINAEFELDEIRSNE